MPFARSCAEIDTCGRQEGGSAVSSMCRPKVHDRVGRAMRQISMSTRRSATRLKRFLCAHRDWRATKGVIMEALKTIARTRSTILTIASRLSWLPPTVTRAVLGLIFVETGWGKLGNLAKVTSYFADLHIPAPGFNAVLASSTELIGGSLLLLGLLTRLAAVPLAFTMSVAIATAKWPDLGGIDDFVRLSELDYIILFVWLAIVGPGPLSLDHLLDRRLRP
jgi:putative oxidoreductase